MLILPYLLNKYKLRGKLIAIQAVTTAIVVTILCLIYIVNTYNNFKHTEKESLETASKIYGGNLAVLLELLEGFEQFDDSQNIIQNDASNTLNADQPSTQSLLDLLSSDKDTLNIDTTLTNKNNQTTNFQSAFGDTQIIEDMEAELNRIELDHVTHATLYDEKGILIATMFCKSNGEHLNNPEFALKLHDNVPLNQKSYQSKSTTIEVQSPIIYEPKNFNAPKQVGVLLLRAEANGKKVILETLLFSLIALFSAIVITTSLANSLIKSIIQPITGMANSMNTISKTGNYDGIPNQQVVGNDEIADLSRGFNEMLSAIKARDKSLLNAQNDLEKRVQMRTQELKARTEELQESNKELENFAYVASHDLQEPLRTIGSFSQLLNKRYADKFDDDGKEFLEFIVSGVHRMENLIKDLLRLSRVGTQKMQLEQIDMEQALTTATAQLTEAIAHRNAKIQYKNLPTILADEVKMIQLFQNLIGNAIKFVPDSRSPIVNISAKEDKDFYTFTIEDNGIGINEEHNERIFRVFQRLNGANYRGTGIGLAICKKIVDLHGGQIWCESVKDEGTSFYFTINKHIAEIIDNQNKLSEA